jgi:UDP-N-acetylmuramoyl-L-alanyl-D-glutamate--2,6-diaminopimelate ligase
MNKSIKSIIMLNKYTINIAEIAQWLHNKNIKNLCLDSRKIKYNDAFVVRVGGTQNAAVFIENAIQAGASALLIDERIDINNIINLLFVNNIPYLKISNMEQNLSHIASQFYNNPSHNEHNKDNTLNIIGITGTNGKTSSAQYIEQALLHLGNSAGTIGTLGCTGLLNNPVHDATTPDALLLQQYLSLYHKQQVQYLAIEVSSHALHQYRAEAVHFNTVLFTNLSRDHLDYHADIEDYFMAKSRLFTELQAKNAVINIDDEYGQKLVELWNKNHKDHKNLNLLTYGTGNNTNADLYANISEDSNGLHITLNFKQQMYNINLEYLSGQFNAMNILGVIGALLHEGFNINAIVDVCAEIKPANGRMNKFGGIKLKKPNIIIDFAHTPDALEKVLSTLSQFKSSLQQAGQNGIYSSSKLYCIFGAGGDRDSGKRPLMGAIACKYADHVIITNDNPRHENPQDIAQQILSGVSLEHKHKVLVELDRRSAITTCLNNSSMHDIVLIAGKGHEAYQDIAGIKHEFSDVEQVKSWLATQD